MSQLRQLAVSFSLGFNCTAIHVGFVVDKVATGQFSLQVLIPSNAPFSDVSAMARIVSHL
jgi:hypothetical protein